MARVSIDPTLKAELIKLLERGDKQRSVADTLNKQGFTTPSGREWNQSWVSSYGRKLGLRRIKKFKKVGKKNVPVTSAVASKAKSFDSSEMLMIQKIAAMNNVDVDMKLSLIRAWIGDV